MTKTKTQSDGGATQTTNRRAPQRLTARRTVAVILEATAELLAEVGFERLSTNMICERAGLTPPALYRYFPNKYAILRQLGEVLMDAQNDALLAWREAELEAGTFDGDDVAPAFRRMLAGQRHVTEAHPSGHLVMRSLHAVPSLCEIRLESHAHVARVARDFFARWLGHVPADLLLTQVRIAIELGYSVIEYTFDDPEANVEAVLAEAADIMALQFLARRRR